MSLLNFSCTPERVLLGVDTLAGFKDGQRIEATKLVHVAHANVVLAGRGTIGLFHAAVGRCLTCNWPSLDVLLEGAERLLSEAFAAWTADNGAIATPSEFVIAGWSDARHRMMVRRFLQSEQGEIVWRDMSWRLGPGECFDEATAPLPIDVNSMAAAARAQVQWVRENWHTSELGTAMGGAPIIGGRLLVAELTRHRFTVECVGDL